MDAEYWRDVLSYDVSSRTRAVFSTEGLWSTEEEGLRSREPFREGWLGTVTGSHIVWRGWESLWRGRMIRRCLPDWPNGALWRGVQSCDGDSYQSYHVTGVDGESYHEVKLLWWVWTLGKVISNHWILVSSSDEVTTGTWRGRLGKMRGTVLN